MAQQPPVDYDRLAKEHGGTPVDYDALAEEVRTPQTTAPAAPSVWEMVKDTVQGQSDFGTGFGKRALETIVNLGDLVHQVPGVSDAIDAFYGQPGLSRAAFDWAHQGLARTTASEELGATGEQLAEWILPASKVTKATAGMGLLPRVAAEAGLGASMAVVQKTDPVTGAVLGGAGPVVGKAGGAAAEYIGSKAVPLVRAGIKAPLALMKQQAGASTAGVNVLANRLAKFMIDNRITSAGQATRLLKNTEAEIQRILAARGQTLTDAPERVMAYLDLFKQRAAKSLAPDQAAAIAAYADELVESSPLGETVRRTVMTPSPTGLVDAAGNPVLVPTTQTTRALREGVPAAEALETARETGRFRTGRQWGEQKGVVTEATKTAERAVRDAVKAALPEIRTPLQQEGLGLLAHQVLERQAWREANRDVISLSGLVAANVNAVLGLGAQWLRNNQVRAGIWADQLAKALATKDAATVAGILHRLGVALGGQATAHQTPVPAAR